jgi:hypothetical protein
MRSCLDQLARYQMSEPGVDDLSVAGFSRAEFRDRLRLFQLIVRGPSIFPGFRAEISRNNPHRRPIFFTKTRG